MRLLSFIFVFGCMSCFAQLNFPEHLKKTNMAALKANDSLVYYQCHVEEAQQFMVTASGDKIAGKPKQYSITEKFVVINKDNKYRLKYYSSSLNEFPNKKFAYLKLIEKPYWNFKLERDSVMNEKDVFMIAALEYKSHETTEYDFKINKQNTNEIIIMGAKVMSQLLVEGDYLLKKSLSVLK